MNNKSLFFSITSSILLPLTYTQAATIDLYIIAGQSNANGRGVVSDLDPSQTTQDASLFYSWHQFMNNATSDSPQFNSGWQSQTEAGNTRSGVSTVANGNFSTTFGGSDWFGPEIGFVARANEINLSPNPMGIIKYAVDGSALTVNPATTFQVSDWDTDPAYATSFDHGDAWRGFKAAIASATTALPFGTTANFKGMIWWQGENGTNATDLNEFLGEVRSHLGDNYGVQNPDDFPIVITGNTFWGAGLEAGVSDLDDDIGFVDSVEYGQIGGFTNTHIGSGENSQSLDVDGNGINDMYDIGVAYADQLALIIDQVPEPSSSLLILLGSTVLFSRRRN